MGEPWWLKAGLAVLPVPQLVVFAVTGLRGGAARVAEIAMLTAGATLVVGVAGLVWLLVVVVRVNGLGLVWRAGPEDPG